jgi:hypothetical protein
MLRLPARTRSSGEKCRGVWYASLGEESAVREREKKGGMVVMGRHPFIGGRGGAGAGGGGEWCHAAGGREGGPDGAWREGGLMVATRERQSWVAVGWRYSVE